jgi:flagellar basal body-associated protein FliL
MFKPNRKIIIILIAFAVIVIAAVSLLSSHKGNNKTPNLDSGRYYDAKSGQTVSNPAGKAPDTYGTPSDQPIYLGISSFIDSGLSDDQLTRLKYAFYNYSIQNKKNIKEVSIDINSIKPGPHNPNTNAPFTINFNVTFDRKATYRAKVEYSGLEDIRLFLYDQKTNAQIYDSTPLGTDISD